MYYMKEYFILERCNVPDGIQFRDLSHREPMLCQLFKRISPPTQLAAAGYDLTTVPININRGAYPLNMSCGWHPHLFNILVYSFYGYLLKCILWYWWWCFDFKNTKWWNLHALTTVISIIYYPTESTIFYLLLIYNKTYVLLPSTSIRRSYVLPIYKKINKSLLSTVNGHQLV